MRRILIALICCLLLTMAASADVDAVLVAGDLYDKTQPSSEAVEMADAFLTSLAALNKP